MRNFFAELKRRKVYRVAVAYAVVAWLLIQIATQIFPFLEIPELGGPSGDCPDGTRISSRARSGLGIRYYAARHQTNG